MKSKDTPDDNALLLWGNLYAPVCPHCNSVFTYKYVLNVHGYGCTGCGKDFGRVIKLKG